MTSANDFPILNDLNNARQSAKNAYGALIQRAWKDRTNFDKRAEHIALLILKAADMLQDAGAMLQHPGSERVMCYMIDSGVHAIKPNSRFELLCGKFPSSMESVVPIEMVPTCPDCLRIMNEQVKK